MLSVGSVLACLFVVELGLCLYQGVKRVRPVAPPADTPQEVPLHIPVDLPFLYALNPQHPEINSHGLRGRDFLVPKPPSLFRILILGDSGAYGPRVRAEETFAYKLETLLQNYKKPVEVLNAGMSGYTTYNEMQFYRHRGHEYQPDLVIVAFCLNDVVNPRLHWNYTKTTITNIPSAAIPNLAYDRDHILPILEAREQLEAPDEPLIQRIFSCSYVYKTLFRRTSSDTKQPKPATPKSGTTLKHLPHIRAAIPTYLTGEDSISIQVLLDGSSAENKWLDSMFSQLRDDVVRSGAELLVVLFPLAYQLNHRYPYDPQAVLSRHLEGQGIACLDLLPTFRTVKADSVFILRKTGKYDIWHLTANGHQLAATTIADYIRHETVSPYSDAFQSPGISPSEGRGTAIK